MKRSALFARSLLILLFWTWQSAADAQPAKPESIVAEAIDLDAFRRIPMLDEGRKMPMDSFARNRLLQFSSRRHLEEMSAAAWLARTFFAPETLEDVPLFLIEDPEAAHAIGLDTTHRERHTVGAIEAALPRLEELVHAVAGPEYLAMYEDLPEMQAHYFGVITAMDDQIGRLRDELRDLGIADNTLISFTSDNGAARQLVRRGFASSGPFRGSKHTPYEGGVRMPTVFEWPGVIPEGQRSSFMSATYDYLPTILDFLQLEMPDQRPLDGQSMVAALQGEDVSREGYIPIGYQRLHRGHNRLALIENRYKLVFSDQARGATLGELISKPAPHLAREFGLPGHRFELYDLIEDPGETQDLVKRKKDEAVRMIHAFDEFLHSVRRSDLGADFEY